MGPSALPPPLDFEILMECLVNQAFFLPLQRKDKLGNCAKIPQLTKPPPQSQALAVTQIGFFLLSFVTPPIDLSFLTVRRPSAASMWFFVGSLFGAWSVCRLVGHLF